MKKIIIFSITFIIFLLLSNLAIADEKPVAIKGLSIGMETAEAKQRLAQLLPSNWTVSKTGETHKVLIDFRKGNNQIFGTENMSYLTARFCPGDMGFAIIRDNFYEGYISTDKSGNQVTSITLSGTLIDLLYSSSKIDIEDFFNQFRSQFNLPEFFWVAQGWQYISPMGYVITITTDKLIEIKKNTPKKISGNVKFD